MTTTASSKTGVMDCTSMQRLCLGLGLLGVGVFIYGILFGDEMRVWQVLVVNFLFFYGLTQAGVVISAIMQVTSSQWGRSLKRLAEATSAFFPVAFILLLILLAGIGEWAPWVHQPFESKESWLNVPFFVARELLAFILLSGLSLFYVYRSLRPDIGMLHESGKCLATGVSKRLITRWCGLEVERESSQRSQNRLAVAILIAYGWVFTLLAFDFVMSLDPHWYSTLMGGYFFIGNLVIGFSFLSVVATCGRGWLGITDYVWRPQFHDLGKLSFGFCMLWAYMFWSQYLVIWYGNLPEETEFLFHRMHGIWEFLAWAVFVMVFVIPFVALLSRAIKMNAKGLMTVSVVALIGMWLERFILVVPSLWQGPGIPIGIVEVLITAGVLGLFAFCYTEFLKTFPVLPFSDQRLRSARDL